MVLSVIVAPYPGMIRSGAFINYFSLGRAKAASDSQELE
jgi:hypothetical protein